MFPIGETYFLKGCGRETQYEIIGVPKDSKGRKDESVVLVVQAGERGQGLRGITVPRSDLIPANFDPNALY